jgi:hypothetical protein
VNLVFQINSTWLSQTISSFYGEHSSSMEDLPNELFFQIFIYLVPDDLFKAFGNLNSRFCALIRSAFIHFWVTDDNTFLLSIVDANYVKSLMINDFICFNRVLNCLKENHLSQLQRLDFTFTELLRVGEGVSVGGRGWVWSIKCIRIQIFKASMTRFDFAK